VPSELWRVTSWKADTCKNEIEVRRSEEYGGCEQHSWVSGQKFLCIQGKVSRELS
jgi:hypothetical protein